MNASERYHVTLVVVGRPVMHGWWGVRSVADAKFRRWIGERREEEGVRVTLVDEETGAVLTTWPDEP